MLSPDRKFGSITTTPFDSTYVFDVLPDLSLEQPRLLLAKKTADGMALDAEGNLWITGFPWSSDITRARPEGTLLPPVPTPAGGLSPRSALAAPTCAFLFHAVYRSMRRQPCVGVQPTEKALDPLIAGPFGTARIADPADANSS